MFKYTKILPNRLKSYRYITSSRIKLPDFPEVNTEYLCNPNNREEIALNIKRRKGIGDISAVHNFKKELNEPELTSDEHASILKKYKNALLNIPNKTHPGVIDHKDEGNIVRTVGKKKVFDFNPREFYEISKRLNLARTDQLGNVTGSKSYFILGELAELEQALIQYTLNQLLKYNFKLISVPDILDRRVIEACGMNTKGNRSQVYFLDKELHGSDYCLSGTSEMALAGFFINKYLSEKELPQKFTTVSRCYRAETSATNDERGIFRVHEFTKVEMFALSTPENSEKMLDEFRSIEEEMFTNLGLHFQTIDMAPHELGAQAYRKFDIEAWMPGRKLYGEISSCSNCTDYQSRRLGIKYLKDGQKEQFVHSVNGTACAIPRMLIALVETYQNDNGTIGIPDVLQKFMRGKVKFSRQRGIPELKLNKSKK